MTPAEQLVARILDAHSINYSNITAPQKGYRNQCFKVKTSQGDLNVILYKTEAGMAGRIARANAVGDFLSAHGLPARRTFSPKITVLRGKYLTKYAAIYHYLPGNTIPWEAYTMKHIKALGETMGSMHAALQHFTGDFPLIADELYALNKRMRRYFAGTEVREALRQKIGLEVPPIDFSTLLQKTKDLPAQPLHMDFVRGNILFKSAAITGILDFEKAALGAPAFDIARTLAFLLVDCKYKTEVKIRKYFLRSGYQKRGGQPLPDLALLEQLVNLFLFHDFYKFLRHNPYEYLSQNEHFTRTVRLLIEKQLVKFA